MSERAAAMLKDDISNLGAVRLSEVEKVQAEILMIVKDLQTKGKVSTASAEVAYV